MKNIEQTQAIVNDIRSIEGEQGWQWRNEQARILLAQDNARDIPQIVSLLKENLSANPDDQASRVLLARTYERASQMPLVKSNEKAVQQRLAISTYREAFHRSPDDLSIVIPYIALLNKTQNLEEADEVLNIASKRKLYHPQLELFRLQSSLRNDDIGSADSILEDLRTKEPNNFSVCLSLALLKIRQNKFEQAHDLLERLRTQEPNSIVIAGILIQSKIAQNKSDEAKQICDQMVTKLSNASAYLLRARTYAALGNNDLAIQDFDRAIAAEKQNPNVWMAKSRYLSSYDMDEAIALVEKALSLAPDDLNVRKQAIKLLIASGRPKKIRQAQIKLNNALTQDPDDVGLRLLKARLLLREGTTPAEAQAIEILTKITEEQPRLQDAWLLVGDLLLRQGNWDKAISTAMRGLSYMHNNRALLLLKARAEQDKTPEVAVATLRGLLEKYPGDTEIVVRLADAYAASDRCEKAILMLENQLANFDSNHSAKQKIQIQLAVMLYKSGRKNDAEKKFETLIKATPDDPTAFLAQIRVLSDDAMWNKLKNCTGKWQLNHPDDTQTLLTVAGYLSDSSDKQAQGNAEIYLRAILDRNSRDVVAMSRLAILLQKAERFTESADLYKKIVSANPENVIAANNLAWILCVHQNQYEPALELVDSALKITPNYVDLIDTRGVIYHRLGRLKEAIMDFEKCLELYRDRTPAKTSSYFHLACTFEEDKQNKKATEHAKTALSLNAKVGGLSPTQIEEANRMANVSERSN